MNSNDTSQQFIVTSWLLQHLSTRLLFPLRAVLSKQNTISAVYDNYENQTTTKNKIDGCWGACIDNEQHHHAHEH